MSENSHRYLVIPLCLTLGSMAFAQGLPVIPINSPFSATPVVKEAYELRIFDPQVANSSYIGVGVTLQFQGFFPRTPMPLAAAVEPGQASPFFPIQGACPFVDATNDNVPEYYRLGTRFGTLLDLGSHFYEYHSLYAVKKGDTGAPSYLPCWVARTPDAMNPCGFEYRANADGSPIAECQYPVTLATTTWRFDVVNTPATVSILASPLPAFGATTVFGFSLTDPDPPPGAGGGLLDWAVVSRPTASLAQLSNATSAPTSMSFTSYRDVGAWTLQARVYDKQGEVTIQTFPFVIPNGPPVVSIAGPSAVTVGSVLTLSASSSDPEGGPLTTEWSVVAPANRAGPLSTGSFGRNGGPFVTGTADIGNWTFKAIVRDHLGATAEAQKSVAVQNAKPQLTLSGAAARYLVGSTVQIAATAVDPDGGSVSLEWHLVSAPDGRPTSRLSTTGDLRLPTRGEPLGPWAVEVRARDDEGETVTQRVDFEVYNDPPRISLNSNRIDVRVGAVVDIETTVLTDDDGGPLSFVWSVRQMPLSAGFSPNLGSAAHAQLATGWNGAGTWILRLEVTDDEGATNSTTHEDIVVVVDDNPTVTLLGDAVVLPNQGGASLFANAMDPDSPCEGTLDRCHSTIDGIARQITDGIVSYNWEVADSPSGKTGVLSQVFPWLFQGQPEGASLLFGPSDLEAGKWTFAVSATDGEGNISAPATLVFEVVPNLKPVAALNFEALGVVDRQGRVARSPWFDSSKSYDPDNQFYSLGYSGISATEFTFLPPSGCFASPAVSTAPSLVLFGAGAQLARECVGLWRGVLQVADDDIPTNLDAASFEFGISSCPAGACLEPTAAAPAQVSADLLAPVQVPINYWIDDRLYDTPFFRAFGFVRFEVLRPDGVVVARWDDGEVQKATKLDMLRTVWNGNDLSGQPLKTGTFSLRMRIFQGGTELAWAVAPDALQVERVDLRVASKGVHLESVEAGTAAVMTLSANGIDSGRGWWALSLVVRDGLGRTVHDFGSVQPGEVTWNGMTTGGANPGQRAAPGDYQLFAQFRRNTGSAWETRAASTTPLAVFRLSVLSTVIGPAPSGTQPRTTVEHWTTGLVGGAMFGWAKLKMMPIQVLAQRASQVQLSADPGGAGLAVYGTTGTQVALPAVWTASDFNAGRLDVNLLVHSVGRGDAVLRIRYLDGSATLGEETIKVHMQELNGMIGRRIAPSPFIEAAPRLQAGDPLSIGIDPYVFSDRVGKRARIYVVPHKSAAQWAVDQQLADQSGTVETLDISGAGKSANLITAWNGCSVLAPDADPLPLHQVFDVVLDFGNFKSGTAYSGDGRLDPGDLLLSGWTGVSVENWGLATYPVKMVEYPGGPTIKTTVSEFDARGLPFDDLRMDYDAELRGRVVVPQGAPKNMPLVVIAHGAHPPLAAVIPKLWLGLTSDENYRGYTYLQEFLAERGIASVSVDLDPAATPGLFSGNAAGIRFRAWLILKNLEWALANVPELVDVDPTKLILVGHSRGGQAMVDAEYLLRNPSEWPDKQNLGSLGWVVRGVAAFAPTTWPGYSSSDQSNTIGVPLMMVHGTADGDVDGATEYARPFSHLAHGTDVTRGLRIAGANHNFFNTSWPVDDATEEWDFVGGGTLKYPKPAGEPATLITASRQQEIAQHILGVYVSAVLGSAQEGMFSSVAVEPGPLRKALVAVQGRDLPGSRVVDDFENDMDEMWSSSGGLVTSTAALVKQVVLHDTDLPNEFNIENRLFNGGHGVVVEWSPGSEYRTQFPGSGWDFSGARTLSLVLTQQPVGTSCFTSLPELSGLTVAVQDDRGQEVVVDPDLFGRAPPVYWSYRPDDHTCSTSGSFGTVRVPFEAFTVDGAVLDTKHVVSIAVRGFSGRVAIDVLEVK